MRYLVVFLALLSAVGCATLQQGQPQLEPKVEMTLQVVDNQSLEVRIITFERFQDNGVRLAHPEPIKSLTVQPGAQAGLMLISGNYKISIYLEGSQKPFLEAASKVVGKETTLHISPTG